MTTEEFYPFYSYHFPSGKKPAVVLSAPEDANYLLDPNNFRKEPILYDYGVPLAGAFLGLGGPIVHNIGLRRPFYAGAPFIALTTALGCAFGIWYKQRSEAYWAERDAVYRHYIQLHPEDFQPKERKLLGDMLKPWYPTR